MLLNLSSLLFVLYCVFSAVINLEYDYNKVILAVISILIFGIIRNFEKKILKYINAQDSEFSPIENTEYFQETIPHISTTSNPAPKGVLFIHGFSASSTEFNLFFNELKQQNIPYYSVSLSGFGTNNSYKLNYVTYRDWIIDAVKGYEVISKLCDDVVVVAHSMGCLLALYIATGFKLNKLILTSPYLTPKKSHKLYALIIKSSMLLWVFRLFRPYVFKKSRTQEQKSAETKRFVYRAVPTKAVSELWKLTEAVECIKLRVQKLIVIVGGNDSTIENESLTQKFKDSNVIPQYYSFPESGHNLFEGVEKESVKNIILKEINQN